jgi:tripartite-type tricarboxylate transporter receptor subunit TctC
MNIAKIGGFKWKETAYKKLNPLLVVKGDADVITFSTPGVRDYVEAGQMKILACMLPNRLPQYPDVATVKEQGFGVGYSIWFGAFVPAKTPDDIAAKLSTVFFNVMAKPDIQDVIKKVGVIPHPIGAAEARAQMDSELEAFGTIMKELGIIK